MAKVSYEFLNEGGEVVKVTDNPNVLRITQSGVGHCEIELTEFHKETISTFAWHGVKQKFGDELAGKESTIADVISLRDRLLKGGVQEWRSSSSRTGISMLAVAVSRCRQDKFPTPADAAVKLATLSAEQTKALTRDKEVATMLDTIRAERRAASNTESSVTIDSVL